MASPHDRAAATERFGLLGGKGNRARPELTAAPWWFRFTGTAAGMAIMLRVSSSERPSAARGPALRTCSVLSCCNVEPAAICVS
jgi:hypothetical protein